jgi:hypothetical protein
MDYEFLLEFQDTKTKKRPHLGKTQFEQLWSAGGQIIHKSDFNWNTVINKNWETFSLFHVWRNYNFEISGQSEGPLDFWGGRLECFEIKYLAESETEKKNIPGKFEKNNIVQGLSNYIKKTCN